MTAPKSGFDQLARIYKPLEFAAFGRSLENARFHYLRELATARSILVLGEGDGRCLERLVRAAPYARIHVIDISAGMLARAKARLGSREAARVVTFEQADMLVHPLAPAAYDVVLTFFFLDCFTEDQAAALVKKISTALKPRARWLYADFSLPSRGLPRLYARFWLSILYFFFHWQTKLSARQLPPAEKLIEAAGFIPVKEKNFQFGLLRSVAFERA